MLRAPAHTAKQTSGNLVASSTRESQQPSCARNAGSLRFAQEGSFGSGGLSRNLPEGQNLRDLQQTIGNRAVMRLLQNGVQPLPITPTPTAPALHRKCACGGAGECGSCKQKHPEAKTLQREPAGGGGTPTVPSIVHEVLRSPGQSLDSSARSFFEPRFGHDFGSVRLHTGASAAESTRAVNARAYTVGSNIVFGDEAFDPRSQAGKKLLAHELTHVLQQPAGVDASHDLRISRPDDPAELQASAISESVFGPLRSATSFPTFISQHSTLARFAEVEPEMEDDVEVDTEPDPNAKETGPRYAQHPRSNSLEGILEQMAMENQRKQAIFEAQVPIATLQRGGKAPDFVTFERNQSILTRVGRGGEVLDTKQYAFHILDAIEYSISFANSNADLIRILRMFIPTLADEMADLYRPITMKLVPRFRIPPDLDPEGTARLAVFNAAVAKRKKQSPALAKEATKDPLLLPEPEQPGKKQRNKCTITPLRGHLGNDPLATVFCQQATKSLFEYRITSPLYGSVVADAVRGNTMFECKCGYESLLHGLDKQKWWAKLQEDKITEQMLRHQRIVQDCGLQYRYIVSNREFADFLRSVWPASVDIMEYPWEPCD